MKHIGRIGLISLISLIVFSAHASNYYHNIKKDLREGKQFSIDSFSATIIWSALPVTKELLAGQANEYQKVYQVSNEERDVFYKNLLSKNSKENQSLFFISFYSNNRKFSDLTNKQAHWDVRLKQGEKELRANKIEKLTNPTPFDRLFYPQLDDFSEGYWIWFDVADLNMPYSLTVYGPEAVSTLEWKK